MFKNFSYLEQDPQGRPGKLSNYTEMLRNNEELLASHVLAAAPGSREASVSDTERSTDNDTNNLVNTTHTSQVRRGEVRLYSERYSCLVLATGMIYSSVRDCKFCGKIQITHPKYYERNNRAV